MGKVYTTPEDKPKWDCDMSYWLNDILTVLRNPKYFSSGMSNVAAGEMEAK